jgi:hypothetical protein
MLLNPQALADRILESMPNASGVDPLVLSTISNVIHIFKYKTNNGILLGGRGSTPFNPHKIGRFSRASFGTANQSDVPNY